MSYFITALIAAIAFEAIVLGALLRGTHRAKRRRQITIFAPLLIATAAYLAVWLSPVRALGDGGLDPFLWFAHMNLALAALAGALLIGQLYGKTPASL